MIYLDAAATGCYRDVDDIIIDSMVNAMQDHWMNPSSLYNSKTKEEINKCRKNIASSINAKPNEIIFTSSASESNNMAIRGWSDEIWMKTFKTPYIITTKIEHKSILKLVEESNMDAVVKYCNVGKNGIVDCESLERTLSTCGNEPVLVSVHFANNEIGSIQPLKDIANLVHRYKGTLHCDATQAFGKIPIDVEEIGIDMMSVSGHKISPILKGIAFLYKKNSINIQPLIFGVQENNLRGGTENTFGIVGLAKALEFCDVSHKKVVELCEKRDYFMQRLVKEFNCKINGSLINRLPNNINVTFPQNITGESLLYMLDMSDIQISTGSACNSKEIKPSHVLKAIGLSDEESMKTIRITIPDDITYEEIEYVIDEIKKAIKLIELN